ncbi:hypothetical protein HD554DRAFT_137806 [Boletus coccyginus]|nr:hypothetical protein HD554DRAFT_137806 [Boletus coccyginus]
MLATFLISFLSAFLLLCLFSPAVRKSITEGSDSLDAHEAGLALVASRNPVRESGPPACMAKLIMLRHKMQTSARRRRSPTSARHSRGFALIQPARPRTTWPLREIFQLYQHTRLFITTIPPFPRASLVSFPLRILFILLVTIRFCYSCAYSDIFCCWGSCGW